jgi:hypothetical protein
MRIAPVMPWTAAAALLATGPAVALPSGAYGWMAELAGACWSATFPDGTRDTQCYETQYDHYLRGTIEILAPGRPAYRGDSVFFWDPARSEMAFHYWSDADARPIWTRIDADSYRVVPQRRAPGGWTDGPALD